MKVHSKARLWEQAIANLLSEPTIDLAAQKTGVSGRTLKRWLALAEFQERYRNAKTELLKQVTGRLCSKAGAALTTLAEVSEDHEARAGSRVAASREIIRLMLDASVIESLEERIRALEAQGEDRET
ncbi:MAG: hypothetical protein ACRD2P_17690 [Terriglobia bacterium]